MTGGASLTQMQLLGVGSDTNVAEGYPRFALTPSQQAIAADLPALLAEATSTPFAVLEARAHTAFFGALGQHAAPVGSGRIVSMYSSTVAIDVVAGALARRVKTVGVVNPVIDCIPAVFRGRGLELVSLSERQLGSVDPLAGRDDLEAVFTASPNNPTGTVLSKLQLERLAGACLERGIPLIIDQCFRAFDRRAQFDTYAVLDRTGVEYVVIEDTGKLWPAGGIKLGFLVWGRPTRLDLSEVASDILLTAPPFSVAVVERFALDMAAGGLDQLHAHIAANREILAQELAGCDRAAVADGDSRASVSRIRLPADLSGTVLWGRLLQRGVHAVPCRPFYWARPKDGDRFLRIALAREPEVVQRAARAVRECVATEALA